MAAAGARATIFYSNCAMRTTFLISLLTAAMFAALAGCRPASVIPPDDPAGPNIPTPPGETQTVSVAWLKTLYNGAPVRITDEIRIAGAVISDDRQGNFYKTLVVDDGTGGIEIGLDMEQIFKRFWIHSRVTVRCNGLWLGSYGGTLQLGAEPFGDYQTQALSEVEIAEHLAVDKTHYGEVTAHTLTIPELSLRRVSTFVAFENVRFVEADEGLCWAETPSATNRTLVDPDGNTLLVRTSRHATFARFPLPRGTGRIEGILGIFNGSYQLVVCDSEKFNAD